MNILGNISAGNYVFKLRSTFHEHFTQYLSRKTYSKLAIETLKQGVKYVQS